MTPISIRAAQIAHLLDIAPADPARTYLSLDCFDTLLWRNMQAPHDLFADLPFPGGAIEPRRAAEREARIEAPTAHRRLEVTLDEIHAQLLPRGSADERQAMVEAELEAEARHCYAFAPTRDLILEAKRRGLKVIIVSDTYLSEPRLRQLIARAGGEDLAAMIDRIFCSCEYGVGKAAGLFRHVLRELGAKPGELLHLGDNPVADMQAPGELEISCAHLVQFDGQARQRLRMEAAAATLIDPATRVDVPAYQPHRAQVALRTDDDPTFAFGHDVLGPIMHGFAEWIHEEAQALERASSRRVKLLFLQRDGHLPARTFATLYPEWADRMGEAAISRVIALGAGFVDKAAIEDYLTPWLSPLIKKTPEKALLAARQLLFDEQESERLVSGGPLKEFAARVLKPANVARILKRSQALSTRLFAHLHSLGVEAGDAVMLVDLGYNGSVQNAVEKRLRTGMDLDVAGRYLLLREEVPSGLDKKGYFDARNYDFTVLTTVFTSIAVVEQFCTMAIGSAVDYAPDGTPIREATGVKSAQSETRERAQEACLAFQRGYEGAFVRRPLSDEPETRRRAAMGVLARLLMMPIGTEVEMLRTFSHDANFGMEDMLEMSDLDAAQENIRRRGLHYARTAQRMYLPGELQQYGLTLNLTIFSMLRFGLEFAKEDVDIDVLELPIQIYAGGGSLARSVGAHRTADGYYRAIVPVGKGQYSIGLFLGRLFEFVQIEEISLQPARATLDEDVTPAQVVTDGMEELSGGLYRIAGPDGFLLVPAVPAEESMLLNLVLRPIVTRAESEAAQTRQAA